VRRDDWPARQRRPHGAEGHLLEALNLGYAIVAPKGQSFASAEDLKGKRVAVQFETEPQNIVGPRDDITAVTVLSPDEGMKALAEGRADAAFL
jgi:polar amino acid transport system substrate-binding protein